MPAPCPPLSGRRVLFAGMITGLAGLAIAHFLRAIVANTPLRITPEALFWSAVVLGGFGVVAGMAVEAVRQLQESNPEPDYHRRHGRRGGPGPRA
ncbi:MULTISPECIES: hypothetical protein [unclassified Cyanobium]|uniref:hypothetical protein n=1 Tax=unclassified Cyanobium TaxID=2627006 RepID=UPI0020CD1BD8|nr:MULTISPECIES: hypothetical protein [unclassified Cyanobium]MCP9860755.1 hypothetical protein [Cyanobium sp. Cruz-8H5]MCP9868115.1 hypothetical protein [Cyanobium sp. Cruz-8D1]